MTADWLAVVPDGRAGSAVAAGLPASRVLRHASGRPWLLASGRRAAEITEARAGGLRAAVIGPCGTDADGLARLLRRVRSLTDVDRLASRLSGSHHLAVSLDGRVRFQGTVAQVRRVFSRRVGGVVVAADRADVLAALPPSAGIDDTALALRLLYPLVPPPLAGLPLWRGVRALPGDHWLGLDGDGSVREVRWWYPPEPRLLLDSGAGLLRERLTEAVAARRAERLSADLSGGLDSSTLCFLAAGRGAALTTLREAVTDPGNDDARWAALCAARLPDAAHTVFAPTDLPGRYAGLDGPADPEEPFPWVRSRADLAALAGHAGRAGTVHLAGHGGDELLTVPPSHLHDLAGRAPLRALAALRRQRARWGWRRRDLLALLDRTGYAAWLARAAPHVEDREPRLAPFAWGTHGMMPPWATPDAVALVRDALREAASDRPEPLAPQRAHHTQLHFAALCGRAVRLAGRHHDAHGTALSAPYLDDRVIEAALAVDLAARARADTVKPVLAAAVRGTVPDALLTRRTKGEFSAEVFTALHRRRADVLALLNDPLLAGRGLVRASAARAAVFAVGPTAGPLWHLDMTLACETWLRARPPVVAAPPAPSPPDRSEETCSP
ncbi:asparagine synthase [Actinocorallia sp. API 0066]|uniref:asparagine synthase-related protein n=1 Tax=Actinocorallia sp. API 0066 TaxID=2896846 RepID=UPI001E412D6A|nr:asparagine synthase-related protein [Actinocorallia sp. API 0066]MCD0449562.1 asparagine synthase [Actinocorallia sp. API 0066]